MKKEDLETGDIIFEKGDGIVAWFIKQFTDSKYSHVALLFNYPHVIHAHLLGGVYITHIDNLADFDVYRIKGGLNEAEKDAIQKKGLEYIDFEYDLLQIFGYLYKAIFKGDNPLNRPDNVICNELIERIYNKIGITFRPDIELGDTTPETLAESKKLYRPGGKEQK